MKDTTGESPTGAPLDAISDAATNEPDVEPELDARLATYVRQGLIQRRTDELGRVTFHAAGRLEDERNRWPVRRYRRDEA